MGNGVGKFCVCFSGDRGDHRKHDLSVLISDPLDEGIGHSFCYVRPDPCCSKIYFEETTTFRTISGASVSANTSTPLSTSFVDLYSFNSFDRPAAFESSNSFASLPLQPIPRNLVSSDLFSGNLIGVPVSGPLERGFLSGPIERGFMSGPLENGGLFSGPMEKDSSDQFQRSFSHGDFAFRPRSRKGRWMKSLEEVISKTLSRGHNAIVTPIKSTPMVKEPEWMVRSEKHNENLTASSVNFSSEGSLEDDDSMESHNLQWAQGKAGEDRVHIVVSEEHSWVFVGIYDGFNGPDAPDYLLSNLYSTVHKELKGLLWDDKFEHSLEAVTSATSLVPSEKSDFEKNDFAQVCHHSDSLRNMEVDDCSRCGDYEAVDEDSKRQRGHNSNYKGAAKKWEENPRRWKCEWDRERLELDRSLKEQLNQQRSDGNSAINHSEVLEALSRALRKTEESYLDNADKMVTENPELALMGSCVLVMLMKGEDVYVMNIGDSRAVLAQKVEPDYWLGKICQDLRKINEETMNDLESSFRERTNLVPSFNAVQLTAEHSTSVEKEVQRIRSEHPDDPCAVMNERVKGSLKVTRAFGAGFLKQPKCNDALLKRFRIDYIGSSPYITCSPDLRHHKLGSKDKFLILSSDGLYQYFTNKEAVAEVELFIALQPEGDPAQHLVEELLFRAAKRAGLDFHQLLEIQQGERRRYHDDISIIVISLDGRIWRYDV